MKKRELEREGKSWVDEGIITKEQLNKILQRKQNDNPNYIIILFAVLMTGLGILTFIMSDWARAPHLSRIIIIIAVMLFLYFLGDVLYRKREELLGISFVVLGYVVFGAGLLLVLHIYHVSIYSGWPFLIWGIVGLLFFYIYQHTLLFSVAIIVSIVGQIYGGLGFSEFNWFLFILFLFGFGYIVYSKHRKLYSYLFSIGYIIQMIVFSTTEFEQYYWFIVLILPLYIGSNLLSDNVHRLPIKYISLGAMFIFGMYQAFILQESWYYEEVYFEFSFFVVWLILFIIGITLKWWQKVNGEMVELILFLPIMFLPFSYLLSLVVLFLFSLGWIFIGYLKTNQRYILFGTTAFLFSTFTVYIQFAWDALDKSLFFFIGGILLFLISFFIEKQRRKLVSEKKESEML